MSIRSHSLVRREGFEPPMFTAWVPDLQSGAFAAMLPTHIIAFIYRVSQDTCLSYYRLKVYYLLKLLCVSL